MSDPFVTLRGELTRAAARAGTRRRTWTRPALLLAAAFVLGGTATAAVISQRSEPSRPLAGTLPRATPSAALRSYSVRVFPRLSAGDPSWCTRVRLRGPGLNVAAATGCGPAPVGTSFLTGVGFLSVGHTGLAALIVGPAVAAVRLQPGRTIKPRHDPRLPQPWQAVIVTTAPIHAPTPAAPGSTTPPAPIPSPRPPRALDAHGQPLPQPSPRLAADLRTPKHRVRVVPDDGCALRGGPPPRRIDVAAMRTPRPVATIGPAFRACYVATYTIGGRYLQAALLVDATDPDRPAPAFPGAVPAHRASVHVPGAMLARRAGNAWIVVRGGPPEVRRRLLDALRASTS
jgi:hypothetical protein